MSAAFHHRLGAPLRPLLAGIAAAGLLLPAPVLAELPAPIAPDSGAAAAGDFIDYFKWTANDILLIVGLVLSVVFFLYVGANAFAKFNQARQGRAEWSEVGVTAAVGAGLLVFAVFLLNEAAGIIT